MTTIDASGLMEYIHGGEFVLMDGALGTELKRRAVPIVGGCCGIGLAHIEALGRHWGCADFRYT